MLCNAQSYIIESKDKVYAINKDIIYIIKNTM